ncbi:LamG-like jellyroll fold domain-containing protein [Xanthomarina sp.]|uniref:LamG-like jellyroll fold domain-containing protein n=1 Tax=Xanthomarina sp. TaxID=1931211 RepID=UPI002C20272D|nr:LamG-like jellyroll fold domain-containing protein [Xanthomarina sp.]HLV39031.1 LamG-like jellyroll fold domain-containing protein [Xanthomarina sp.]
MNKVKIVLWAFIGLTMSCSNSTEEINETTVTISDITITINENPTNNQLLGTVEATTNQGNLTFSITEQSPNDALVINPSTGEIRVLDQTLFDFDTNPIIIGVIKAENGEVFDTANITINLNDSNEITAFDFNATLEAMPLVNQSLGIVEATTSHGSLTFSIIEQTPNNTLKIDQLTGELKAQYVTGFIGNPIIVATARIQNEVTFKNINIRITLVSPCNTNTSPVLNAYYPMNSNVMDESGFNNHGTVFGAVLTTNRFSESESAYSFDGIDDSIQIEDNNQLFLNNEFTISAWIYPEEIKTQEILRKGSHVNGNSSWPFGLALSNSNDIIFSITAGGVLYQARKQGYQTNNWYLITGVLKNQKMYLYVNEDLVAIKAIEGDIFNDNLPLVIGTRLNMPSNTFKGKIDDVRIYSSALCQLDIAELFNN